jgi:hypothetical protein
MRPSPVHLSRLRFGYQLAACSQSRILTYLKSLAKSFFEHVF